MYSYSGALSGPACLSFQAAPLVSAAKSGGGKGGGELGYDNCPEGGER